jgi:hypothetical protein
MKVSLHTASLLPFPHAKDESDNGLTIPSGLSMMATAMHQLQIVITFETILCLSPNVVLFKGIMYVKDASANGTSPPLLLKQSGFLKVGRGIMTASGRPVRPVSVVPAFVFSNLNVSSNGHVRESGQSNGHLV